MRKFTLETKVTFYASLGYVGADRTETRTIAECGLSEDEFEEMTDSEVEDFLYEQQEIWLQNVLNSGIEYKGEDD